VTLQPRIETRWVCIAASEQTRLAAQLSSYFNDPGVYFAVFQFPDLDRPHEDDSGTDGYFAQIIGKRTATWINNSLARIQPDRIILLGLSHAAASYLRAVLPAERLLVVKTEAELLALPFVAGKPEPLVCKPAQAVEGLLRAKSQRVPLFFSDSAPNLPSERLDGRSGLILLENTCDIGAVATINYAISIDADVAIVPAVQREDIQSLPRELQTWAKDRSSPALLEVRKAITDRIKGVDFSTYQFATFFTVGLPYGLILKNIIPFTHVPNGPYCDVFIADSIVAANAPLDFGNALLFGIDEFITDETRDVATSLEYSNFLVTELTGKDATYNNLDKFAAHPPYDLLHISSHGGETDGYFVKQQFEDRDGKLHTIEYFEVVSFSEEAATEPGNVMVARKIIFTALDGASWGDRPLSKYARYVGDDMMKALKEDRNNLKRTPVSTPIALSCHVKCHQSFHQGAFDCLAAHSSPIVFNNSCSSSHELAESFIAAGARVYIGTLWNVGNRVAVDAAESFYPALLAQGNVLHAFGEMLSSITDDRYRHIYIMWGLHFSILRRPIKKSDDRIVQRLMASYFLWVRKFATTKDPEIRRNCVPILRFFDTEIGRRLTPEQRERRRRDTLGEHEEIERAVLYSEPELNELTVMDETDTAS
jgi:hypothetical protein